MSSLDCPVLVLNQGYSPVITISAKRAILMLVTGAAEVLCTEEDKYASYNFQSWADLSRYKALYNQSAPDQDWVHSEKLSLMIPRIVRLISYAGMPVRKVRLTRRNVFYRDNNQCQYCGHKFRTEDLTLDHVIPTSRGGKDSWENIVTACQRCNFSKEDRTPAEAKLRLLSTPVRPKFIPAVKLRHKHYSEWDDFVENAYFHAELGN